jgi:2-polyprenyl-3-methyl-5-hydroxy-6-metoxy-1,4-benzoquinol methylase
MKNFKSEFWSKKIIGWEKDRYKKKSKNSVQERLNTVFKILEKKCFNKNILEIGCGSGLLAEKLIEAGAKSYKGYDFAGSAIVNANERCKNEKRISFHNASITQIENNVDYDIIFSLGLIDWLKPDEINSLVKLSDKKMWLHSFSEKRASFTQLVHKLYVIFYYGFKNGMYIPRYDKKDDIKKFFHNNNIFFLQNEKLSFGVIASSFKINND